MTALLKAADLTQERFLNLIASLRQPDAGDFPARVWLEAPDGWALDWWDWGAGPERYLHWCGAGREPIEELAADCLARSTAGRLFDRSGELRWRTIPALGQSCWRTVFLGNADWVGAALDDCSAGLDGLEPHQNGFLLWGQQTTATPGEWIELRIPHRFRYPVTGNPRTVRVVVEEWRDEPGEPHFVRLCGLEPYRETT